MSPPPQPAASDTVPELSVSITGEVMVASITVFFFLFVFIVILFLRKNRYLRANPLFESSPPRFLSESLPPRALDPSFPVTVFRSEEFKDGIECAVCLSDLVEGEVVRLLPGCRHGFHLECVDTWFSSNPTCPICRSSVRSKNEISGDLEQNSALN